MCPSSKTSSPLMHQQQEFPCVNDLNHPDPPLDRLEYRSILDPHGHWVARLLDPEISVHSPLTLHILCKSYLQLLLRYHITSRHRRLERSPALRRGGIPDTTRPNLVTGALRGIISLITESGREHWRRLPDAGCHQRPKAEGLKQVCRRGVVNEAYVGTRRSAAICRRPWANPPVRGRRRGKSTGGGKGSPQQEARIGWPTKLMLVCADDAHLQSTTPICTPPPQKYRDATNRRWEYLPPNDGTGPWVEQCSVSPSEGQTRHVSCDQEHDVYRLPSWGLTWRKDGNRQC